MEQISPYRILNMYGYERGWKRKTITHTFIYLPGELPWHRRNTAKSHPRRLRRFQAVHATCCPTHVPRVQSIRRKSPASPSERGPPGTSPISKRQCWRFISNRLPPGSTLRVRDWAQQCLAGTRRISMRSSGLPSNTISRRDASQYRPAAPIVLSGRLDSLLKAFKANVQMSPSFEWHLSRQPARGDPGLPQERGQVITAILGFDTRPKHKVSPAPPAPGNERPRRQKRGSCERIRQEISLSLLPIKAHTSRRFPGAVHRDHRTGRGSFDNQDLTIYFQEIGVPLPHGRGRLRGRCRQPAEPARWGRRRG